jgi:hypothetical protein
MADITLPIASWMTEGDLHPYPFSKGWRPLPQRHTPTDFGTAQFRRRNSFLPVTGFACSRCFVTSNLPFNEWNSGLGGCSGYKQTMRGHREFVEDYPKRSSRAVHFLRLRRSERDLEGQRQF